jgi:phosphoribosyl 1,2-cyclic phosphodiesterase
MSSCRLKVKLWGVRGSIPTPDPRNQFYGGNTPCVEIGLPGGEILILDAGIGIRQLGQHLMRQGLNGRKIHLFLTHFHWDHIHGLPFFAPLFENARISYFSGGPGDMLESALRGQMKYPYFPVDFGFVPSQSEFCGLADCSFRLGDTTVSAFPVNHPQGAYGFRVESRGASVVYAPDREPGDPELDRIMREAADSANVLILDSQYTREEYKRFKGWGHSTWNDCVDVARDAKAERLILFHHNPEHDDAQIASIEQQAQAEFPSACSAREGTVVEL